MQCGSRLPLQSPLGLQDAHALPCGLLGTMGVRLSFPPPKPGRHPGPGCGLRSGPSSEASLGNVTPGQAGAGHKATTQKYCLRGRRGERGRGRWACRGWWRARRGPARCAWFSQEPFPRAGVQSSGRRCLGRAGSARLAHTAAAAVLQAGAGLRLTRPLSESFTGQSCCQLVTRGWPSHTFRVCAGSAGPRETWT